MSSPSNPVVSPADLDEVVVYDSGGEEFEHRRHGSIRDRSQVFLCKQVEALTTSLAVREGELRQAREDHDVARTEKEAMEQERNTSVCVVTERALEVQGLREHLTQMEGQPAGEAEGQGRVPEGDAVTTRSLAP
ncbi:hypothetical protein C0989_009519 [Termitomyces sp. Mn162]|nr:hypothetical protein C0989_009519 [Termitomyces sp. Mn162]